MIELCNKRTFFDLRRFDAETLQFCHFHSFAKKEKVSISLNRKNKNYPLRLQPLKKGKNVRALRLCLFLPVYLTSLMMPCVRVVCCVRSLFREKSVKAQNAGCFECPAPMRFSLLHLAGMGSMRSGVFVSSVDMRVERRLCFAWTAMRHSVHRPRCRSIISPCFYRLFVFFGCAIIVPYCQKWRICLYFWFKKKCEFYTFFSCKKSKKDLYL